MHPVILLFRTLTFFSTFVTSFSMLPPHRPPFSPSNPSTVNLQYDNAGNPYHQDEYGQWVPHIGFTQVHRTTRFC